MTSKSLPPNSAVRNFYFSLSMLVCAIAFALHSTGALAADPSLHQVYDAANAGNYAVAQGMMDQVLRDHPNSAKAHFVEAELMAKQGQLGKASAELQTAEKLDPALSFAKPAAVDELKGLLRASHAAPASARVAPAAPGLPWGMIIAGMALLAAIVFFLRSRSQMQTYIPAGAGAGYGGPAPYGPTSNGPAPYGPTPMGPVGGSGVGSGILGGLATGAAVGAGMVAGEAFMHRMLDGNGHNVSGNVSSNGFGSDLGPSDTSLDDAERRYDMGGSDFGVNDASSWDSSGGGSDDWS